MAQQHLRNVLAYLDVPTLGQPEAYIHAKEGLFDESGNIGVGSMKFLQKWMDHYVAWVKKQRFLKSCFKPAGERLHFKLPDGAFFDEERGARGTGLTQLARRWWMTTIPFA